MKTTGIVRRIDELGRIVIPKEIRKSLRIQDGENLEIIISEDGNIILKRYMLMNIIESVAQDFTDAIYGFINKNIVITDIDKIIAFSGDYKDEYINEKISLSLLESIKRRECMTEKHEKNLSLVDGKEIECTYAINTIIVNGDAVGLIIIFSQTEKVSDSDERIIKIVSKFLEKQLSI